MVLSGFSSVVLEEMHGNCHCHHHCVLQEGVRVGYTLSFPADEESIDTCSVVFRHDSSQCLPDLSSKAELQRKCGTGASGR